MIWVSTEHGAIRSDQIVKIDVQPTGPSAQYRVEVTCINGVTLTGPAIYSRWQSAKEAEGSALRLLDNLDAEVISS